MTTLFEDLRLALREVCRSLGLSGTTATVVPLLVLGVVLNAAALSVTESVRDARCPGHRQNHVALQNAARTEIKVMKAVVNSTLKKVSGSQWRWCVARQRIVDSRTEATEYNVQVGFAWAAPGGMEGCDVTLTRSPARKTAIAFVQC
jgi:hypothetical protein